jgi:hypothetical protein
VGHVPHLAFVLNKVDQIEADERPAALGFLRDVLSKQTHVPSDVRIFTVSARQALDAKRTGNADLLAWSGFDELEIYLTEDLARRKSSLLQVAIARKAAAVLSEGLMTLELALRSLQLPLADLEERAAAFDRAVEDFGWQRLTSKDLLAGDRARVLEGLEMRAEHLRQEANRHLTDVMDRALAEAPDSAGAQDALGAAIPLFFDEALRDLSDEMSQLVDVALRRHQGSADCRLRRIGAARVPGRPQGGGRRHGAVGYRHGRSGIGDASRRRGDGGQGEAGNGFRYNEHDLWRGVVRRQRAPRHSL